MVVRLMKNNIVFMVGLLLLVLPKSAAALDHREAVQKIVYANEVLQDITTIPEKIIPPALLKNCYGIAIVPNLLKAGFVVGGKFGRGIISVRDKDGTWQNPFFITLAGGSFGWQIGAQSTDIILVFKSKSSVDKIRNGKFTLGVDGAIAAGPVGRQFEASTDIYLKAEIYSYSRTRGLFAGIALDGSAIQLDMNSTQALYGAPDWEVNKKGLAVPAEVTHLKESLAKHTGYRK